MIFLIFIIIPIIEISIFITVGPNIGILNTIGIILLTALVGIFLVRRRGLSLLFSARQNMYDGVMPTNEIKGGIPDLSNNPNDLESIPNKLKALWETANYAAMMENMDTSIGMVLDQLNSLGLEETLTSFFPLIMVEDPAIILLREERLKGGRADCVFL